MRRQSQKRNDRCVPIRLGAFAMSHLRSRLEIKRFVSLNSTGCAAARPLFVDV
jgi:hypothetical protein